MRLWTNLALWTKQLCPSTLLALCLTSPVARRVREGGRTRGVPGALAALCVYVFFYVTFLLVWCPLVVRLWALGRRRRRQRNSDCGTAPLLFPQTPYSPFALHPLPLPPMTVEDGNRRAALICGI